MTGTFDSITRNWGIEFCGWKKFRQKIEIDLSPSCMRTFSDTILVAESLEAICPILKIH